MDDCGTQSRGRGNGEEEVKRAHGTSLKNVIARADCLRSKQACDPSQGKIRTGKHPNPTRGASPDDGNKSHQVKDRTHRCENENEKDQQGNAATDIGRAGGREEAKKR